MVLAGQKCSRQLLSLCSYCFRDNLSILRFYSGKKRLPLVSIVNINDINSEEFQEALEYMKDKRIFYNCFVNSFKPKLPHYKEREVLEKIKGRKKADLFNSSVSLIVEKQKNLKPSSNDSDKSNTNFDFKNNTDQSEQFPLSSYEKINLNSRVEKNFDEEAASFSNESASVKEDIELRLKTYNEKKEVSESSQMEPPDEELPFKFYKDTLLTNLQSNKDESEGKIDSYFGTPNPNLPKSSVPCGGCGSHLHCQDEGLPGYIPSEEFIGKSRKELRSLFCQRCFFLRNHKTAINIRVSPDVYEEALKPVVNTHALVIVVVDLLDVPCSVWPDIDKLIGTNRPVVVVGNKIDLLPLDGVDFLETIRTSLISSIRNTSLGKTNIKHVCVVSAKTGYGIEDLITEVSIKWGVKGDIFLLGCTNAGKSTLFNALLGSDLCKVQASSLIQRATASPWPGTTLNLLKFPIMRLTGKRLQDRKLRLEKEKDKELVVTQEGRNLRKINTLKGHIGQTYSLAPTVVNEDDAFGVNPFVIPKEKKQILGINEKDAEYRDSKWCFDTPGTVQPDQFLALLTHDELLDVLPRKAIIPRTFSLHNSQSLFLGGLARLDLLYCDSTSVRLTICCSPNIPVTIVNTSDAADIYRTYIGSSLLKVPRGSDERMKKWPYLQPTNILVKGIGYDRTASDIVLSSAGFICVSGKHQEYIDLRAWTPGGRGVYVRSVSMLPFATKLLVGKRMRHSPLYHTRKAVSVNY